MSNRPRNTLGTNTGRGNFGPTATVDFNVSLSFQVRAVVGKGVNSIVCSAVHLPSGAQVAITRYEPFDSPLYYHRILKEIFLLRKFEHSKYVVSLLGVQQPESLSMFHEVYFVREFMELDLHRIIQSRPLSDLDCQYYLDQILRGLRYIHSAGIVHCELRPSKIMVNANGQVKIRGFGSSRLSSSTIEGEVTAEINDSTPTLAESVSTGWYMAPELLLDACKVLPSLDMWLLGCILGEMFTFVPLFPGVTVPFQLDLIFSILGTPPVADLSWVSSERVRQKIQSFQYQQSANLDHVLENHPLRRTRMGGTPINPLGVDLIKHLLTFSPLLRITSNNAMIHPYLSSFHGRGRHFGDVRVSKEEFHSAMALDTTNIEELRLMTFQSLAELNRR